jgi:hypothetical protein
VVVAGAVDFGVVVVPLFEAVLVPGVGVPVVAPDAPLPEFGVAGNEVNGVGSGGSGFDNTPATSSLSPVSSL